MTLQPINENLLLNILEFIAEKHPEKINNFGILAKKYPEIESENLKDHLEELKTRNLIKFERADSRAGRSYVLIRLSEKGKLYMRKKEQEKFLIESYRLSGGKTTKSVKIPEIADKLNIPKNLSREIADFLYSDNKLNFFQVEDMFKMQASGIREAEKIIEEKKMDQTEEKRKKNCVFIVHGHDDTAKEIVARFVEKHGLKAIILHEQADEGMTIIEKFEKHSSRAGYAIVLFTPDDVGTKKPKRLSENTYKLLKPRARQNVVFELGFFVSKLGRENVRVLYKKGVEILTDYEGVLYTLFDLRNNDWKIELHREIRTSNLPITELDI